MPRTASTYFQQALFPQLPGFRFFGVERTHYSAVFQRLLFQDDSLYREDEMAEALRECRESNCFLSNELFVGQSLYLNGTTRSRTARRLQSLFPKAEIVLVIRNQLSLLQSLYALGVYSGYTVKPENYLRFMDGSSAERPLYPTFDQAEILESYLYSALISLYQSLFEKVHVFLFEDFVQGPQAFAERLCDSLTLPHVDLKQELGPINRSLSGKQVRRIRKLNSWKDLLCQNKIGQSIFNRRLRRIEYSATGGKPFSFDAELSEKVQRFFWEDNKRLREMQKDLGDSGVFREHYLW
jgi:hypothetical protein